MKAYDRERSSHGGDIFETQIKNEYDVEMNYGQEEKDTQSRASDALPPQVLLLQLENGVSIFLMLRKSNNGEWGFVSNRYRVSKSMMSREVGTNLAVDPSSRYMAIGCSESLFAIYALNSREELRRQYSQGSSLRYVQAEKNFFIQGVIHKMEFLYPAADHDDHIILLVLNIWKGKTRMLLYEWQAGEHLRTIRPYSHKGHPLEESHQMPLLVIPLTIKTSFILVSENSMATCSDILLGSPKIVDFNTVMDEPKPLFHGATHPLWVAWTRPIRRDDHAAEHDDIYIVREDGQVKNLEIQSEDDLIAADNNIGSLQSNCGTALACLDYNGYDNTSEDLVHSIHQPGKLANFGRDPSSQLINFDLLITGGDSCSGGAYLVSITFLSPSRVLHFSLGFEIA